MTQAAVAPGGATPFPRTLAQRDRERLARYASSSTTTRGGGARRRAGRASDR